MYIGDSILFIGDGYYNGMSCIKFYGEDDCFVFPVNLKFNYISMNPDGYISILGKNKHITIIRTYTKVV